MRCFYKVFVTGMTDKGYPTPKFFVSLAYLVSPPLNPLDKGKEKRDATSSC